MEQRVPHRKLIRHFNEPGHAHELTFSCYQRLPLLKDDRLKRLLSQSIDRAVKNQRFGLLAFVFMPEHVHLIVLPRSQHTKIERLLYEIKRPFSYRVKQLLEKSHAALLKRLAILERPGKKVFRFWQEGPGYDRNLVSTETLAQAIDYVHLNPVRRGLEPSNKTGIGAFERLD
jgi:putative transposase